jgi:hypothetical protein
MRDVSASRSKSCPAWSKQNTRQRRGGDNTTTGALAKVPKTVGSPVPTVQKTGRYTGQTGRFIEVLKI